MGELPSEVPKRLTAGIYAIFALSSLRPLLSDETAKESGSELWTGRELTSRVSWTYAPPTL